VNSYERRILALEERLGLSRRKLATLELLIRCSHERDGTGPAHRRELAQCDPQSPLIVMILVAHYGPRVLQ
jgi:hypothetical protein